MHNYIMDSKEAGAKFGAIQRFVVCCSTLSLTPFPFDGSLNHQVNLTHRNKTAGTVGCPQDHRRGAQEPFVAARGDKVRQDNGEGQNELDAESLPSSK